MDIEVIPLKARCEDCDDLAAYILVVTGLSKHRFLCRPHAVDFTSPEAIEEVDGYVEQMKDPSEVKEGP